MLLGKLRLCKSNAAPSAVVIRPAGSWYADCSGTVGDQYPATPGLFPPLFAALTNRSCTTASRERRKERKFVSNDLKSCTYLRSSSVNVVPAAMTPLQASRQCSYKAASLCLCVGLHHHYHLLPTLAGKLRLFVILDLLLHRVGVPPINLFPSPLSWPHHARLPAHAHRCGQCPAPQSSPQGSMAHYHYQAEASYFTGQAAEPHSHNYLPQQPSPPYLPALDGVGALFPSLSVSRKGSQDDTNGNFDDDEAFSPQASPQTDTGNATPRADRTTQLHQSHNGAVPGSPSPPTARSTPIQGLPYLPSEELSEFRRQRAAKKKHNGIARKCPVPSPTGVPALRSKRTLLAVNAPSAEAQATFVSVSTISCVA